MVCTIELYGTYHGLYGTKSTLIGHSWYIPSGENRRGAKIMLGGSRRYYVLTTRVYDTLGSRIVLGGSRMQGAGITMSRASETAPL